MTATITAPPRYDAGALLSPVLRHWIDRLGGELGRMCGYQLGLYDEAGNRTGRLGGKLLRPTFTLLSAGAAGGDPAVAVPAAAAVELQHNASLIHDDIMDGDRERRHRPTVWARFGVPAAILAGDAMIALGFEILAGHRHPRTAAATAELAAALRLLAHGQQSDLRFESEAAVDFADCLGMIAGKTGGLLGCACRLGAVYSGAPPQWADRFAGFGTHLGVAFQLVDDVLGIWGDPAVTGKPVGADLRARKKSAPVVAALGAGTPEAARFADLYARDGEFDDARVATLTALVEAAGGRTRTLAEAERRTAKAWGLIDGLDLDPAVREALTDLTGALLRRTS
jgi:geranylgeranyl diphosphate synthase, type I